jgi:copper chaperone CopZ
MVKGVQLVSGDIAGKTATFEVESDAALVELKKALADAGYEVA